MWIAALIGHVVVTVTHTSCLRGKNAGNIDVYYSDLTLIRMAPGMRYNLIPCIYICAYNFVIFIYILYNFV